MIPLFKSDASLLATADRERAALLLIALEMKYRWGGIAYLTNNESPYHINVLLQNEDMVDWRTNYDRMEMWARTSVTQSMVQSERWDVPVRIQLWAKGMWDPAGASRIDEYVVRPSQPPSARLGATQVAPTPDEAKARAGEPAMHCVIGSLCYMAGKIETAKEAFRRAIMLDEKYAEAWMHLGNMYYAEGDFAQSIVYLRMALSLDNELMMAWAALGNALCSMGSYKAALTCFRHVLSKDPDAAATLHNMGNALISMKKFIEAEHPLKRALALDPNREHTYNTLGNLYFAQDNFALAAALYEVALTLNPRYAPAHTNFGNALLSLHKTPEAISAYEKALTLSPTSPGVRYNLALAYLREGRWIEGWKEHEARWDFKELRIPKRKFKEPLWDGRNLDKPLLVYAEQGLGDTIQFCRFLPQVRQRVSSVIFEVPTRLHRLMSENVSENVKVIAKGDELPECEYRVPLMSLPMIFGTTLQTLPVAMSYLKWPHEIKPRNGKLRVGLAWAGNPGYKSDKTRSIPAPFLTHLLHDEQIEWVNLQRDKPEDVALLEDTIGLKSFPDPVDFADTAEVMLGLDLIVTSDTSVAHLAGALGRPVWMMLSYLPDWRWLHGRGDYSKWSPWYPSMQTYRQTTPGDWEGVIQRINPALQHLRIFYGLMTVV